MRIILSLISFLILVGCTSASGPLFTESHSKQAPAPGKALVYVYRVDTFIAATVTADFLDNGKNVGAVNVGGYISYETDPGPHELLTETSRIDKAVYLSMEAGKTYYLRLDYDPGMWTGTFLIRNIPENEALPQLQATRYQGK